MAEQGADNSSRKPREENLDITLEHGKNVARCLMWNMDREEAAI